jgi:hypothetical protein
MRRKYFGLSFGLAACLGIAGCGLFGPQTQAYPLDVTGNLPAAQGLVTVKPLDNGDNSVEVVVNHLAPPERSTPNATAYVVWFVPRMGGEPQNMGRLALDKNLRGTFRTKTAFRDFDVRVTAEPNAAVTTPTHDVMRAAVSLPQRTVR